MAEPDNTHHVPSHARNLIDGQNPQIIILCARGFAGQHSKMHAPYAFLFRQHAKSLMGHLMGQTHNSLRVAPVIE